VNKTPEITASNAAVARVLATHAIHQKRVARPPVYRPANISSDQQDADVMNRIQYLNNHDRDDRSW
jgi:hypothetical protein